MRQLFGIIISFTAGALTCAALLPAAAPMDGDSEANRTERQSLRIFESMQPAPAPAAQSQSGRQANHRISDETVSCCLKVAEDIDSSLARRLKQQQVSNPDEFAQQLQINGRRLMELCELRSDDPRLYDMKVEEMQFRERVLRLGSQLRHAINNGNEQVVIKLEDQLREQLYAQVVMEIAIRGQMLNKLQEQVQQELQELDAMAESLEQTVDTRLVQIKNNEWPPKPGSREVASNNATIPPE